MEQETHENENILIGDSLGRVNGGTTGRLSKDSNNSTSGVVLENPVVLNSGETVSARDESWNFDADNDGLKSTKRVVDHEGNEGKEIGEPLDEGTSGNSSNFCNEVVPERVIVVNSREIVGISGDKRDSCIKIDELGLSDSVTNQETCVGQRTDEAFDRVDQDSYLNSSNAINRALLETVIAVNSEENAATSGGNQQLEIKGSELGLTHAMVDKSKIKVSKGEKQSCVIDMTCGGGGGGFKGCDEEMVCRICHLSSEGFAETISTTSFMNLIQLGCGCKDELGIVHAYCAEAWFKLKGNRVCEICGETAKNITGVRDNRFMEEWNHRRFIGSSSTSSDSGAACWRGQPFCNFLLACLVIAVVLPWFLRVNMF